MSESFEKAVKAAARAIDPMAWDTHYRFAGWEERTGNVMPSDAMNHLTSGSRSLARAALRAALPHLTAEDVPHVAWEAWFEGWDAEDVPHVAWEAWFEGWDAETAWQDDIDHRTIPTVERKDNPYAEEADHE